MAAGNPHQADTENVAVGRRTRIEDGMDWYLKDEQQSKQGVP